MWKGFEWNPQNPSKSKRAYKPNLRGYSMRYLLSGGKKLEGNHLN